MIHHLHAFGYLHTFRYLPAFRCLLLLVAGLLCSNAAAQVAPEGNAHPKTQNISEGAEQIGNPFGEHSTDLKAIASVAQKQRLATSVDLDPLRSLAVFHNGRVKILQTLAAESVRRLTGRRAYVDYIKSSASSHGVVQGTDGTDVTDTTDAKDVKDVKFDPLFTLLDLTIDPAFYLDKPLIGIEYLPLRTAILEAGFPGDNQGEIRERWMKLARVTPLMIDRHLATVMDKHGDSEPYIRAAGRVDDAVRLFMQSKGNFMMVAPERADLPWQHLATLPPEHPARAAAAALGAAWRAADAAKVSAAIAELATQLPKINSAIYPTASRQYEAAYNLLNAFEWGSWAYLIALVAILITLATGRTGPAYFGAGVLLIAVIFHAVGFVLRCLIAERFAIQNQFESMTGLSLFAVVVGGVTMLARRQWLFGAASAGVGFLVLLTATQAGIPGVNIEREAAILNTSVLLKYHVTTVLVSYGLISLGFMCSLFYLGIHYFASPPTLAAAGMSGGGAAGSDTPLIAPTRSKLLADLDASQLIVMQLAFWTLGVGTLLGAWWADHSWGRWWAFDPKEIWALITWMVYLVVVHVRIGAPAKKGITTAWLSIIGFIVMLWTYFGVNLLLPGLHAYA